MCRDFVIIIHPQFPSVLCTFLRLCLGHSLPGVLCLALSPRWFQHINLVEHSPPSNHSLNSSATLGHQKHKLVQHPISLDVLRHRRREPRQPAGVEGGSQQSCETIAKGEEDGACSAFLQGHQSSHRLDLLHYHSSCFLSPRGRQRMLHGREGDTYC